MVAFSPLSKLHQAIHPSTKLTIILQEPYFHLLTLVLIYKHTVVARFNAVRYKAIHDIRLEKPRQESSLKLNGHCTWFRANRIVVNYNFFFLLTKLVKRSPRTSNTLV